MDLNWSVGNLPMLLLHGGNYISVWLRDCFLKGLLRDVLLLAWLSSSTYTLNYEASLKLLRGSHRIEVVNYHWVTASIWKFSLPFGLAVAVIWIPGEIKFVAFLSPELFLSFHIHVPPPPPQKRKRKPWYHTAKQYNEQLYFVVSQSWSWQREDILP